MYQKIILEEKIEQTVTYQHFKLGLLIFEIGRNFKSEKSSWKAWKFIKVGTSLLNVVHE
jgi:hypothetical protein